MTAVKTDGFERFLRKPDPGIGAILIYGEDPGAVRDVARRVVQKVAGRADDPFAVVVLDDAALSSDAGRLVDEVQSLSLLGSSRVVWVRGAGASFAAASEAILAGQVKGNLVVAEAGPLARGAALRAKFEESAHVFVLPLYEASNEDAGATVENALNRAALRIDEDAKFRLIDLTGRSPDLLQREVEKLVSYCLGGETVTLADVEAVCGDSLGAETDELVDAALGGSIAEADRYFFHLTRSGVDSSRILSALHGQLLRLIDFKESVERGVKPEQAVKAARPPIFFKRQSAVLGQLRAWPVESLLSASSSVHSAILQTRLNPELAEAQANRCVLAIARNARAAQARIN